MAFNFDRFTAVAGLIVGVVGVALTLTESARVLGVLLIFLAVSVPLAVFLTVRWYARMSPFTVLESRKHVLIKDSAGKSATMRKELDLRANFSGLDSFTHRNISSDGTISGFTNEFGAGPPHLLARRDSGIWEVSTYFSKPLLKGEKLSTWLEFEITDGYTSTHERSKTIIDGNYKSVLVTVESTQRPFLDASCNEYFSGLPIRAVKVKFEASRHKLEVRIQKPKRGAIYQIEWLW